MSDYFELSTEVSVPAPVRLPLPDGTEIIISAPTRRQVREIRSATTDDAANEAMFGAAYPQISAVFDDQPVQHWDSFVSQVSGHFFGSGADASPGKSQD